MNKILPALLFYMLSARGTGQGKIHFIDETTADPIAGLVVMIISGSGQEHTFITDGNGDIAVETLRPPVILSTQHIGYFPLQDTVGSLAPTISLLPREVSLAEVVVTGQFEPQSAKQSVYQVRSIKNEEIQALNPTSLQDVLRHQLNISFSRDNATGSSNKSLQGLSGQYVKVLIDGVPVIGKGGVNNETDLNQINVHSIDRIEIVEGPMAVNYGADALAGVINLITKKDQPDRLSLNLGLHEETAGNEYTLFDDGIHNPSFSLGYKPSRTFYLRTDAQLNRFGGWTGNGDHRDKDWYPKTQYMADGLIRWEKRTFDLTYRVDYLDELLENLGPVNNSNPLKDPFAIDEKYHTLRWQHQLQSEWRPSWRPGWRPSWSREPGQLLVSTSASWSLYERTSLEYTTNLATKSSTLTASGQHDTTTLSTWFYRSTMTNLVRLSWLATQLGADAELSRAADTRLTAGDKWQDNLGVFASAEIRLNRLKIRPGIRFTYNSLFSTTPTPTLNFKYDLNPQTQLRLSYGRGYRAPSLRELYFEFVDSNHNILGNENLRPEYSHNVKGDIVRQFQLRNTSLNLNASVFYNHIDDKITYFTPAEANNPTTYVNLLVYKTTGGTLGSSFGFGKLSFYSGISWIGNFQQLAEYGYTEVPRFVFSPQVNLNGQYTIQPLRLTITGYYTYLGATKDYILNSDETPELRKIDDYHWLDLSVSGKVGELIKISAGSRNLFDVTSLNSNMASGNGAHSSTGRQISYGRSYFLKINYSLNLN